MLARKIHRLTAAAAQLPASAALNAARVLGPGCSMIGASTAAPLTRVRLAGTGTSARSRRDSVNLAGWQSKKATGTV